MIQDAFMGMPAHFIRQYGEEKGIVLVLKVSHFLLCSTLWTYETFVLQDMQSCYLSHRRL